MLNNKHNEIQNMILANADLNGIPVIGNFELLPLCNMDCKMCYIKMSQSDVNKKGGLKTADEWLSIAREARNAGTIYLLLTGGEVFLYKDFKYLYTELTKMGFIITVNTNATMINEEVLEWFAQIPPKCVNVTLYGGSDETYERLCNNPKGFTQVKKAIDLMIKEGMRIHINSCITPHNKDDIDDIYKFIKERNLSHEFTAYQFPPMRRDESMVGKGNRFKYEDAAKYSIKIKELYYSKDEIINTYNALLNNYNKQNILKEAEGIKCRAGHSSYWITWDGKMTPCGMMNIPYAKPFEEGFMKSFEHIKKISKKIILSEECANCENKELCNVCAASALTETGSFKGTPQYLCNMTREKINILKLSRGTI